jgi:two-component system sensor histidine kinase YesM
MKYIGIKAQIIISSTLVMIAFTCALGFFTVTSMEKRLRTEFSLSNRALVDSAYLSLAEVRREILDITRMIYMNPQVLEILAGGSALSPEEKNKAFSDLLNVIMLSKSALSLVAIFPLPESGMRESYISFDYSFALGDFEMFKTTSLYRKLALQGNVFSWEYVRHGDPSIVGRTSYNKLLFGRRILAPERVSLTIGYLILAVNENYLRRMLGGLVKRESEELFLCDENGAIIFRTGGDVDRLGAAVPEEWRKYAGEEEGVFNYKDNGARYLVSYFKRDPMGWAVFHSIDTSGFLRQIFDIKITIGIIVAAILLMHIIVISMVSRTITSRLARLLDVMGQVERGNFKERFDTTGWHDEIGILMDGYNKMAENIELLIDERYITEVKKKDSELTALYAQINPHFLYNILDLIYWQADGNGQTGIADNICTLSNLLRASLNSGRRWITVAQEEQLLRNYCSLQNMILSGKTNFIFSFDEQIKDDVIPGMVLQPLVENAILHGLKFKRESGTVKVSGGTDGERLLFEIEDDGTGMSEEEVNRAFAGELHGFHRGYGLRNIIDRLELYYADEHKLEVLSSVGGGTKIIVMLKRGMDLGQNVNG